MMDSKHFDFVTFSIQTIARRVAPGWQEDFAQELWVEAMRIDAGFDASRGVPYEAYVLPLLRLRANDIFRRAGNVTRHGNHRNVNAVSFSLLASKYDGSPQAFDPVDRDSLQEFEAIDWAQLGDRVSNEAKDVRAFYLYLSGHTMKDVARILGSSESRVSQLLSSRSAAATTRLERLYFKTSLYSGV